jgi:hypothetical protein
MQFVHQFQALSVVNYSVAQVGYPCKEPDTVGCICSWGQTQCLGKVELLEVAVCAQTAKCVCDTYARWGARFLSSGARRPPVPQTANAPDTVLQGFEFPEKVTMLIFLPRSTGSKSDPSSFRFALFLTIVESLSCAMGSFKNNFTFQLVFYVETLGECHVVSEQRLWSAA